MFPEHFHTAAGPRTTSFSFHLHYSWINVQKCSKDKAPEGFLWELPSLLRNPTLPGVPGCCVTAVQFSGVLPGPGRFLMHHSPHCHDRGEKARIFSMTAGITQGNAAVKI